MVRIAPIRVISFFLLAACAALGQSERPSADLLQWDGSKSLEVQHQEMQARRSLPDAPSVQPSIQAEKFRTFAEEARSLITPSTGSINDGVMDGTELGPVVPGPLASFTDSHKAVFAQKKSRTFFGKYLCPSLLKRKLRDHPLTSGSFVGRASYAVSHIFVTRDEWGRGRLNTSYFLGVLTLVAAHTAHRPYWARSSSATLSNFGSTIGSDAGMNLFHEFEPGMWQMAKGHTPMFVSRIEGRITHHQDPREVVSHPAR
jgi:hypothetical protein